jgi:hypothetical protein
VKSELDLEPSSVRAVMIEEIGNSSNQQTATTDEMENHAVVDYEVNVFSSNAVGRKSEAKAILSIIDGVLLGLNFQRLSTMPASLSNSTRYRLVARYTVVVSKDEILYRR